MDSELVQNTSVTIPVRLLSASTYAPVTGVTAPTVYIHPYQSGSVISVTVVNGTTWKEINSTDFPGVYDLTLSATNTATLGLMKVSVQSSSPASDVFIGLYNVVTGTISSFYSQMTLLRQAAMNKTKIDPVANTFTIYGDDNTTPVEVFYLFDANGNPTSTNIYERSLTSTP